MPPHRYTKYGLEAVSRGTPDYNKNDPQTDVADTLANIMHYCDAKDIDFDTALESARGHHAAETNPQPPGVAP